MSDNFEKYSEYNKILRAWFVAFGIGGPALFLVNDAVRDKLVATNDLKCVALLFILGAASQILVAFLNKVINWYIYNGDLTESFQDTKRYKVSLFISEQFWIDIALDLFTVIVYGVGIWTIFAAFTS